MNAAVDRTSPVLRAVCEAVRDAVSPTPTTPLIQRALAHGGLPKVPVHPVILDSWLRDSLMPEVKAVAGDDAVGRLRSQLQPLVQHLSELPSGEYATLRRSPRTPHDPEADHMPSPPPPLHAAMAPPPLDHPFSDETDSTQISHSVADEILEILEEAPEEPVALVQKKDPAANSQSIPFNMEEVPRVHVRVLVASDDVEAVRTLQARFGDALQIEHVDEIGKLMELAPAGTATGASEDNERVALVLDCQHPTVHPASVAGLAEELPGGWWVIAWGIDGLTWEELTPDRAGPVHWVRCAPQANWTDVIGLSSTLLAAGSN